MINMTQIVIFFSVTVLVFSLLYLLYWLSNRKNEILRERLNKFSEDSTDNSSKVNLLIRKDDLSQIPTLNRLLKRIKFANYLRLLLDQADISMEVGKLILLCLISGSVSLLFTLGTNNPILIIGSFLLFGNLPLFHVYNCRRKRRKLFEQSFPDALDMMRNAVQAGFGFVKGLKLVADECPDPIGKEFNKTFEEINLGLPLRDALTNLTKRIDSIDLKLFITAILIQRESGGNLTEILFKISNTIRERFKLMGQIKAFTAQGRLSGIILGLLPVVFALIISTINPKYLEPLFSNPVGKKLIVTALIMQITGFVLIRKILKIKMF